MKKKIVIGILIFLIVVISSIGFDIGSENGITGRVLDAGDSSGVSRSFSGDSADSDIGVTMTYC